MVIKIKEKEGGWGRLYVHFKLLRKEKHQFIHLNLFSAYLFQHLRRAILRSKLRRFFRSSFDKGLCNGKALSAPTCGSATTQCSLFSS